jgi:WXG100 family type VII secretion target
MLIAINPAITEELIGKFRAQAEALQSITSTLDSEVNSHVGSGKDGWQGRQADDFNSHWNGEFKTSLTRLHEALGEAQVFLMNTLNAYRELDHQA